MLSTHENEHWRQVHDEHDEQLEFLLLEKVKVPEFNVLDSFPEGVQSAL